MAQHALPGEAEQPHNLSDPSPADAFAARGAAINLGLGSRLTEEAIAGSVHTLLEAPGMRRDLSRAMKGIVDGLGTQRIADAAGGLG